MIICTKKRTEMETTAVIMDMCGTENIIKDGVDWKIWNRTIEYTVDTLGYLLLQELELNDTTDAFNALPAENREAVMTELLGVDTYHCSYSDDIDFTQGFNDAYPLVESLKDDYVFLQVHRGGDTCANWSPWMMFKLTKETTLTAPEVKGTCTRNGIEYEISNWYMGPSRREYGIKFMYLGDQPDNEDFLEDDEIRLHLENTY